MKISLLSYFVILVFVVFSFTFRLSAQTKVTYIQNISFQDALPSGNTNGIVQDNYGFLWFATWTGLFRYDGNNIVNYTQKFKDEMGRKVSCIFNASDNSLWMGTFSEGLFVLNNTNNKIIKIDSLDGKRLGNIFSINEDKNKQIFIGMQDGLVKFDLQTKKSKTFPLKTKLGKENINCMVTAFAQDKNNKYWIGSHIGLHNFDAKTGRFTSVSPIIQSYVYQILSDGNIIWVVSKEGLYSIDISNPNNPITTKHILAKENEVLMCLRFSKQDPSKMWVGGYSGLYLINKADLLANKADGFQLVYDLQVTTFHEDRTNILWISSEKGIYKADFYQKRFHIKKDTEKLKSVLSIATDKHEKIWLGTWGKGLFTTTINDKNEFSELKQIQFKANIKQSAFYSIIYSMVYSNDQYLWIATRGAGVFRLKMDDKDRIIEEKAYASNNNSGIDDDYLMNISEDYDGNIWAGSWDGFLYRYDKKTDRFVKIIYFNDLQKTHHFPIVKVLKEKKGSILIGTGGNGLVRLWLNDDKTKCTEIENFTIPAKTKSLQWYFILDLIQTNDCDLLVSTEGGLARYNTTNKTSIVYNEKDGLQPKIINSLVEDNQKKIWLGTESGLLKLDFKNDNLKSIREFSIHDGLQSNRFNQRALARLGNNKLVFGGEDGFSVLIPDKVFDVSIATKVVLTDFKLFNQTIESGSEYNGKIILEKSISVTKKINLDYDENTFTIGFSALNFTAPQKIKYAYKLSGLDENWVTVNASYPFANFTKLKSGKYHFKIKCTNSDEVWSNSETELVINISPPWWKSKVALLFYFGLIFVLLYIAKYLLEYKHKTEMDQFELKKNVEVYDTQLKFFTNISHEFRTPLTVIIGLTELLKTKDPKKNSIEKDIIGIDRNAKIMKRLVDDLMDLRKMEKQTLDLRFEQIDAVPFIVNLCENFNNLFAQKKVSFSFTSQLLKIAYIKIDKARFESVIYNLLSNAFKFTPQDGSVTCTVLTEKKNVPATSQTIKTYFKKNKEKYLVIRITDSGAGIPEADLPFIFDIYYAGTTYQKGLTNTIGTGIGLPFTRKIVEQFSGFIEVESQEDKGSSFSVFLPITNESVYEITQIIQGEPTTETLPKKEEPVLIDGNDLNMEDDKLAKYLILVVDDNDDLRAMVRAILPAQYQVIEAIDGVEGFELAKKEVPDLIITDVLMPRMTGTELCDKLKQTEITNHIPIIMLTALPTIEDRIEGLRKGADSYIPKPFDPPHLLIRIEKLIERSQKLKSRFMRSFVVQPNVNPEDDNFDPGVEFLNKVRLSVDKNISNPDYSIGDLCIEIGMSRMQLFRKLKATTDISANKIIRLMRLEKAKKLLLRGDLNVADVTYSVGFNDLQYFRKCFKEEFGITPSDYIKQQKT